MRYDHVLAAIDTSEDSIQVLETAQQLATDNKAKLSLVTVVKPFMQVYGGIETISIADIERQAIHQATELIEEHGAKFGVDSDQIYVIRGNPSVEIRNLCKELNAGVVVIGTHGRHGMGLMLIGSTANGVLHGTECDVLAVRIKEKD